MGDHAAPTPDDERELRHLRERQREIERRIRLIELKLGIVYHPRIHVAEPPRKETG